MQLIGVNVPLCKTCLKLRFERLIIKFRACNFIKVITLIIKLCFQAHNQVLKLCCLKSSFFYKGF